MITSYYTVDLSLDHDKPYNFSSSYHIVIFIRNSLYIRHTSLDLLSKSRSMNVLISFVAYLIYDRFVMGGRSGYQATGKL